MIPVVAGPEVAPLDGSVTDDEVVPHGLLEVSGGSFPLGPVFEVDRDVFD